MAEKTLDEIKIGEVTYNLNAYSFNINRDVNKRGRPSSEVRGGIVNATIEALDQEYTLWALGLEDTTPAKGEIIIRNKTTNELSRKIKFEGAYVVAYSEHLSQDDTESVKISVTISCHKLTVGEENTLENDWPDMP